MTKLAAFQKLDFSRIDVWAIVNCSGLGTINEPRHHQCQSWLQRHGYSIDSLDCRDGIETAITNLGKLCRWEEQFGYTLKPGNRNLNALRDGFSILQSSEASGGRVLELICPDLIFQEDSDWLLGLLSIAQDHSLWELALGRRFFTLLVIQDDTSVLIGQAIKGREIGISFWSSSSEIHNFIR